ncbi:AbfB domain-containing protein [Streptomyces sp. Root369]|uniref:AbfB domain-containing protein n=1 Tax=Streptomyces sp. Root369 TaxID=1736523 RepID=UPI0007098456|nr:AbfB domain-containing protein [Streptomyces sp. Root369]KQW11416.1 hypothetical protein ASD08_35685 [Streptomyces sp. Root369]
MSDYFQWPARLRSLNYPDRLIRHRLFEAFVDPDLSRKPEWRDSNFWLVPGLADQRLYSIQAVTPSSKFYLRHQGWRVKLQELPASDGQFAKDATFELTPPLKTDAIGNGGLSFRSLNFPSRYLRHRNFELWLDAFEDSDIYRQDASFRLAESALAP